MTEIEDAELLRRYAAEKSEKAFAELVRRHVDLVYAVALRQVGGDVHLAKDVAQVVFAALARKASSLVRRPALGGWLYRAAQFTAIDVVRAERRRRAREQEAPTMHEFTPEKETGWEKLRPTLDRVIGELSEGDRDAVVLRFFEGRPFADVGMRLRLTENAARMRVERALAKLHALLARRGVTSTTTALAVALANQVGMAAPAGLAASVSSTTLAGATVGGGWIALLQFIAMTKIKIGIVSAITAAVLVTGIVEVRANRGLRAELGTLRAVSGDLAGLQKQSRLLTATLGKLGEKNPEADELVRLRNRVAQLKARPAGVVDAEMKPASAWRNAGRATPEAANETYHWALVTGNLDVAASLVVFSDDTKENREKFMAHFGEAVRAKYRTPERLVAAAVFGAGEKTERSAAWRPDDAYQVIGSDDHVGGDGARFGQIRLRTWYRTATGEREGGARWQSTPDGWAMGAFYLTSGARRSDDALAAVLSQFNPATGERLPAKR